MVDEHQLLPLCQSLFLVYWHTRQTFLDSCHLSPPFPCRNGIHKGRDLGGILVSARSLHAAQRLQHLVLDAAKVGGQALECPLLLLVQCIALLVIPIRACYSLARWGGRRGGYCSCSRSFLELAVHLPHHLEYLVVGQQRHPRAPHLHPSCRRSLRRVMMKMPRHFLFRGSGAGLTRSVDATWRGTCATPLPAWSTMAAGMGRP